MQVPQNLVFCLCTKFKSCCLSWQFYKWLLKCRGRENWVCVLHVHLTVQTNFSGCKWLNNLVTDSNTMTIKKPTSKTVALFTRTQKFSCSSNWVCELKFICVVPCEVFCSSFCTLCSYACKLFLLWCYLIISPYW